MPHFYLTHVELSMRNVSLTFGGESVLTFENLANSIYKPNRGLRSGHWQTERAAFFGDIELLPKSL